MTAKFKISSWTVNEMAWEKKKKEIHKINCMLQVSCLAPITITTKEK